MMKRFIPLLLFPLLLSIPNRSYSELINDPGVKDGETSVRVFRFAGGYDEKKLPKKYVEYLPIKVLSTIGETLQDGKKCYSLTNRAELINGNSNEIVSVLQANPKLRPLSVREREYNPQGELIKDNYFSFVNNSYSYPDDIYDVYMLVFAFRGLSFERGKKSDLFIWTHPAVIIHVFIETVGEETVTVPGGTFDCYEVEMTPDVGSLFPINKVLARIIQPFVPSHHFWYAKDHDHALVKYSGVGGLPGSPHLIAELSSLAYGP